VYFIPTASKIFTASHGLQPSLTIRCTFQAESRGTSRNGKTRL
jgi:hypothetical protein